MTDLMSAIFYGGSQPLQPGGSFHMPVADAMRVVDVTMKAEAREQVVTPAGTFQTIRVQPMADAGVVKNRGNIWIWYTDDDHRMPVQMRARLFWGTHHHAPGERGAKVSRLLNAIALAHEPLQPRLVDDVVSQFFIGKHGQRGLFAVGYQLRGLVYRKAPVLADHRHHHVHHHLQAADFALLLHLLLRGLIGLTEGGELSVEREDSSLRSDSRDPMGNPSSNFNVIRVAAGARPVFPFIVANPITEPAADKHKKR